MDNLPQLIEHITQLRVDVDRLHERLAKMDDFMRSLDEQKQQVLQLARRTEDVSEIVSKVQENLLINVWMVFLRSVTGCSLLLVVQCLYLS